MLEKIRGPKNDRDVPSLALLPFMVHWYGPSALAKTGLLTVISGLFGQYADQRVQQAALDTRDPMTLVDRYDYSRGPAKLEIETDKPLWVDYIADLGDGFDSTYAMASLLASESLDVKASGGATEQLPAGRLLIIGGDAVYPYASEPEYERRFIQPYDLTVWHKSESERANPERRLFMLPGNHDWYDGLAAFDRLFCQRRDDISEGRIIGPYRCRQHRSYFAIKLPHDWWIWGIDTQLSSNLDVGQIKYFHLIAESMKKSPDQAKVILCIPEPAWYHGAEVGSEQGYSPNLQRILNLAIDTGKVCTVIAGDWHHYCRYFGLGHRLNLITAGGGGAYLAPTHQLEQQIEVPWKGTGDAASQLIPFTMRGPTSTDDAAVAAAGISVDPERRTATQQLAAGMAPPSVFPDRRTSKRLSWGIPTATVTSRNFSFALGLGVFYWLMTWLFATSPVVPQGGQKLACEQRLASIERELRTSEAKGAIKDSKICERPVVLNGLISGSKPKESLIPGYERPDITLADYTSYIVDAAVNQFALALFGMAVFAMLYRFSGAKHRWSKALQAGIQWLMHVVAMVLTYELINFVLLTPLIASDFGMWLTSLLPEGLGNFAWHLISAGLMVLIGGTIGGLIWGTSLFFGNRVFRNLHDEAFSILRHQHHKHFLRMKITPDALTIYPVALRRVPGRSGWRKTSARDRAKGVVAAFTPQRPLAPELIEGPIVIRPSEVRDLTTGPKVRPHTRAILGVISASPPSKV